MTHYIHNINPIVIQLGGPLAVRWYGLSYLFGFIAAILLLRRWSKKGTFEVPLILKDGCISISFLEVFSCLFEIVSHLASILFLQCFE